MKSKEIYSVLWEKMQDTFTFCPDNCSPVTKHTDKTAFFPVGTGCYKCDSSNIDILVLGQDFGTTAYYEKIINGSAEDTDCNTWINMLSLFKESGIDEERCFFSNVYMDLRNTDKMTGPYPGRKYKLCREESEKFLKIQIETIKPKSIITLGKIPAQVLTDCSLSGLEKWDKYQALRNEDIGLVKQACFDTDISCICVALEHPSMRNSNVGRRKYNHLNGNQAEVQMLKDMYKAMNK